MRRSDYVEADPTVIEGRDVAGMEIDLNRLSGQEPGYPSTVPALQSIQGRPCASPGRL